MEEDVLDIIQKIQEARSPKYFIWTLIKNMKAYVEQFPTNISFVKDDSLILSYSLGEKDIYVNNDIIDTLRIKYNISQEQSLIIIKKLLNTHLRYRRIGSMYSNVFDLCNANEYNELDINDIWGVVFKDLKDCNIGNETEIKIV